MKKLLIVFIGLLIFAGCKKSEYTAAFDDVPEARIRKEVTELGTALSTAPDGWIGNLSTQAGGGYSFYMTFDAATENVKMYADLNDNTATNLGTSTYRILANVGAELIFDTYNYISMLQDPNPSTFGGVRATGFKSDVEFLLDHKTADSAVFIGKKYRQKFKLVKATPQQKAAYTSGNVYSTFINSMKGFFSKNVKTSITLADGTPVEIIVDNSNAIPFGKTIIANAQKGGTTLSATAKYAFTIDQAPILNSGLTIAGVTFVKILVKAPNSFVIVDDKGTEYPIKRDEILVKSIIETRNPTFVIADVITFPGWGNDYINRTITASTAVGQYSNGGVKIRLGEMWLQNFNSTAKTFILKIFTPRIDGVAVGYTINLNYKYDFVNDNTIKFTYVSANATFDANLHDINMLSLLGQRIDADNFKLDYFTDTATGNTYVRFSSIQNPNFVFTASY
jgi:hypothetical protein